MKNLIFTFTIIFCLVLQSCKKKNELTLTPVDPSTLRIKSMIFTDSTGKVTESMSFQYNNIGQLTEMHRLESGTSMLYEYLPGLIIEKFYYADSLLLSRTTYSTNSQGLIISGQVTGYTGPGDSLLMYTYSFKYDPGGYLIESKEFHKGDTSRFNLQTWEISNGNILSYTYFFSDTSIIYTETYDYFINTTNMIGNINLGKSFLGKSSVNLIKTTMIANNSLGTKSYTYSFDSQNRVITSSSTQYNTIYNIAYTYY